MVAPVTVIVVTHAFGEGLLTAVDTPIIIGFSTAVSPLG